MNYYVTESFDDPKYKYLGGTKARDDIESVFKELSMKELRMGITNRNSNTFISSLARHIRVKKKWDSLFRVLKKNDSVFLQYIILEHSIFFYRSVKALVKRGVNVVVIIHDLESLQNMTKTNASFLKRNRIAIEEKGIKHASKIIVHNNRMKDVLVSRGFPAEKIIVLGIFDYLLPANSKERSNEKELSIDQPIIVSGNLSKIKSAYIYDLPSDIEFNLYGTNYSGTTSKSIHYMGTFEAEDIPFVMTGSFGLVWDGESTETCSGKFGEYLRINNPHKTSLYLVSGIPVIIWREAALAEFVLDNNCGVVIDKLSDIKKIRENISKDEYEIMANNARRIGHMLSVGHYAKAAIKEALN